MGEVILLYGLPIWYGLRPVGGISWGEIMKVRHWIWGGSALAVTSARVLSFADL